MKDRVTRPPARVRLGRIVVASIYLLSPALALIDWKFDLNLRVPGLFDRAGWSLAYYTVATLFGMLMVWVPQVTSLLAMLESAISVAVNAIGFVTWYAATIDHAMPNGGPSTGGTSGGALADEFNFVGFGISLVIVFVSYITSQLARARSRADADITPADSV